MKKVLLAILLLSFFLLNSCFFNGEEDMKTLRIAIQLDDEQKEDSSRYKPLLNYLSELTGLPCKIVFEKNSSQLVEDFGKDQIDLVFLEGFAFTQSHLLYNAVPLVWGDEEAKRTTTFLVEKENTITELKQIAGKKLAFSSQNSSAGHLMPRHYLNELNLNPEKTASHVLYAGKLQTAINWLEELKVDMIAVDSVPLKRLLDEYSYYQGKFRQIWESPPSPSFVWATRNSMPRKTRDKLSKAFLELNPKDDAMRRILSGLGESGFHEAKLSDFEILTNMIQKLRLLEPAPELYTMKIGVPPYLAATDLHERFQPLAQYLTGKLNRPIKVEVAKDDEEFVRKAINDEYEIMFTGQYAYHLIAKTLGKRRIIGRLRTKGSGMLEGVIAVRKESEITSLKMLKGKQFAFGGNGSTQGYAMPLLQLCQEGVKLKELGGHTLLGNQQDVATGILNGQFDAGGMRKEVFDAFKEQGLRILATTEPVQEDLIICNDDLPRLVLEGFTKSLLEINEKQELFPILQAISPDITGIEPETNEMYMGFDSILKEVEECLPETMNKSNHK